MIPNAILILNIIIAILMSGIIWYAQIVYYLFRFIGRNNFALYKKEYDKKVLPLGILLMISDLASGSMLIFFNQSGLDILYLINLMLIILIIMITFLIEVPAHLSLESAFTNSKYKRLLNTNLIRAIIYTIRVLLLIFIFKTQTFL